MKKGKVVFLDRDGVINRDRGSEYIDCWKKFRFLPGSLRALKLLKENQYTVVVVSNQAGIAKGSYALRELQDITRRMKKVVKVRGGRLDAIYYCPHQKEDRCCCRKPKTALFRKAKKRFDFQYKETFVIGDSQRDIAAGKILHCRTVLVLSGREKHHRRHLWDPQPDMIKKNLLEAVLWILRKDRLDRST